MRNALLKAALVATLALVACGRLSTDSEEAQDALDTTEQTSNESSVMALTSADTQTASCGVSSEQLAEAVMNRVKAAGARLKDASCVSATRAGNKVTYVMNACTGRYGKVTVTGTVDVAYTANADCSVDAVASGKGIKVNKATIDLDSTAHFTKGANGVETMVVQSHSQGSGENVELDHNGSYTVTRDPATECRTLDGQWSTDWSAARGSATTSTVASALKKCADACPAAGGSVVHNGFAGRKLTLTFDGSAVAKWQSSQGKSGTINLDCTP